MPYIISVSSMHINIHRLPTPLSFTVVRMCNIDCGIQKPQAPQYSFGVARGLILQCPPGGLLHGQQPTLLLYLHQVYVLYYLPRYLVVVPV